MNNVIGNTGIKVIVNKLWPKEKFSHIENVKSHSHEFVHWLSKYLKFDPWSYYPKKIFMENDPIYYFGAIICGPETYEAMKRKI